MNVGDFIRMQTENTGIYWVLVISVVAGIFLKLKVET